MVHENSLLTTQHYYVRIKDCVAIQVKSVAPSQHLGVVANGKGTFESPLTTVANISFYVTWY